MSELAITCRDSARRLLRTARETQDERHIARLVKSARLYWHWYLREL
ncbi:MAG: hypothetical protein WBA88_13505 [Pseudaminobacter sp.]